MPKQLLCLCLFMVTASCGFAQTWDTLFYSNKSVLIITTATGKNDSVIAMYDQNGKSILNNTNINHTFFDNKFGKKRVIKVDKKVLIEDYCVSEADTVFNYFQYDEAFQNRLQHFYNELENKVIYPKNALKKGVQANVKVSVIIDSDGSITHVFPITKHEWGFEETLIRTLNEKKQFGFVMYKNKPIKYYLEIPFAFKIIKK